MSIKDFCNSLIVSQEYVFKTQLPPQQCMEIINELSEQWAMRSAPTGSSDLQKFRLFYGELGASRTFYGSYSTDSKGTTTIRGVYKYSKSLFKLMASICVLYAVALQTAIYILIACLIKGKYIVSPVGAFFIVFFFVGIGMFLLMWYLSLSYNYDWFIINKLYAVKINDPKKDSRWSANLK